MNITPGQRVKLEKKVSGLQSRVDNILKSRDFEGLGEILDQLDHAKTELYYYCPDHAPTVKRDCGLA
jgi:hypothetical protein